MIIIPNNWWKKPNHKPSQASIHVSLWVILSFPHLRTSKTLCEIREHYIIPCLKTDAQTTKTWLVWKFSISQPRNSRVSKYVPWWLEHLDRLTISKYLRIWCGTAKTRLCSASMCRNQLFPHRQNIHERQARESFSRDTTYKVKTGYIRVLWANPVDIWSWWASEVVTAKKALNCVNLIGDVETDLKIWKRQKTVSCLE